MRSRRKRRILSRLHGGPLRRCFRSRDPARRALRNVWERSHQAVKIVSTGAGGALWARQNVNGRVRVVDSFRVLVHDHIAAYDPSQHSVAHRRFGGGVQRRDTTKFPRDARNRTNFGAPNARDLEAGRPPWTGTRPAWWPGSRRSSQLSAPFRQGPAWQLLARRQPRHVEARPARSRVVDDRYAEAWLWAAPAAVRA
jgi:hypothetical protein